MDLPKLTAWVGGQIKAGSREVCCYEVGPCGYALHRQLLAVGAESLVVAPQDWDERGQRVKTDARDARALCVRLWRWLQGDTSALCVVRVPPIQEKHRALCRQRHALVHQRQQAVARGRSLALLQGCRLPGRWWAPRCWAQHRPTLPAVLADALEVWVRQAQWLEAEQRTVRAQILTLAPATRLPVGIGGLSWMQCTTEVLDWHGSATAANSPTTPASAPANTPAAPPIAGCHESPRQSTPAACFGRNGLAPPPLSARYWVWKKLPGRLDPVAGPRQRKRRLVAAARHLAIDRTTPEKLGLETRSTATD